MNWDTRLERIYHPYNVWEDYKCGFYDNMSGEQKKETIKMVVSMFCDSDKTREYMNIAKDKWVYSFEHNLTNSSMNRIAYIGQAAACLFCGAPSTVTMEAWSEVPDRCKGVANAIAKEVLSKWIKDNNKLQLKLALN